MATEESLMLMDRYSMSVLPELLTSGFGLNHNTLGQFLDPGFVRSVLTVKVTPHHELSRFPTDTLVWSCF